MTPGEAMFLCGCVVGFCGAFILLGVAWSVVDAVQPHREGGDE